MEHNENINRPSENGWPIKRRQWSEKTGYETVACESYGRDGGIKEELNYKVPKGNHRKHNKTQILFSCDK